MAVPERTGAVEGWAEWVAGGGLSSRSWEGLLFDLDGTLVDTLPLHYEAYRQVFAGHGLTLRWDDFVTHSPSPAAVSIPNFVAAAGGLPDGLPPTRALHQAKKDAFVALVNTRGPLRLPPAELFEKALGLGHPVGVVTSGNRQGAELILRQQGWLDGLTVLVTGDDVTAGKPGPEPYERGAAGLGLQPRQCLAFEDTATGWASALAAGVHVIDVSALRSSP